MSTEFIKNRNMTRLIGVYGVVVCVGLYNTKISGNREDIRL